MEGVKGFTKDLKARLGAGIFQFAAGGTYEEEGCKTRKNGFHYTEYAPDCLDFYSLGEGNRYFLIEAEGDINEAAEEIYSCTKITLKKELGLKEFAAQAIVYMVKNPDMSWERQKHLVDIARDKAEGEKGGIAIARGKRPIVHGEPGSILGLVLEDAKGEIIAAKVFETKDERHYTLTKDRELQEVEDEAK